MALTWLCNFKNLENQLARWLEHMQEYDFHRSSCIHGNAEGLSWVLCKQCGRESHAESEESNAAIATEPHRKISRVCPSRTCGKHSWPILTWLRSWGQSRQAQTPPMYTTRTGLGVETTHPPLEPTKGERWSFMVKVWRWARFFFHTSASSAQQVQIVMELHAGAMGGHLAMAKMHSRLKQQFYWPGYWKDVQLYFQACISCATWNTQNPKRRAALQTICAGHPWKIVAMDLTGPFPEGPSGNCYIMVVGDYFTKWMESYAVPDQEATTNAQKLVDKFFCHFSVPSRLHSDHGKQFESKVISVTTDGQVLDYPIPPTVWWACWKVQSHADIHAGDHCEGAPL